MAQSSKKVFFGGVAVGAVIAPIVMFSAGWIVTSGAAGNSAREMASDAVVASLTPICVIQFSEDTKRTVQLAALKELSQWKRPDFVAQQGWATMPGADSANGLVASECARRLAELEK
jgi:hypothetical protein